MYIYIGTYLPIYVFDKHDGTHCTMEKRLRAARAAEGCKLLEYVNMTETASRETYDFG